MPQPLTDSQSLPESHREACPVPHRSQITNSLEQLQTFLSLPGTSWFWLARTVGIDLGEQVNFAWIFRDMGTLLVAGRDITWTDTYQKRPFAIVSRMTGNTGSWVMCENESRHGTTDCFRDRGHAGRDFTRIRRAWSITTRAGTYLPTTPEQWCWPTQSARTWRPGRPTVASGRHPQSFAHLPASRE